jgi:hypothetical protein
MMLERLARYTLSGYFIFGPGTWREREDREAGSTIQEENDLSLLYYYGYPRLLNIGVKKWSLDRRPQDLSIHKRWHLTFCLETGELRPPVVTFAAGTGSQWGARDVPLLGIPCGSAPPVHMVANSGCRALLGGALPESCDQVMILFLSFSLFLVRSWL